MGVKELNVIGSTAICLSKTKMAANMVAIILENIKNDKTPHIINLFPVSNYRFWGSRNSMV